MQVAFASSMISNQMLEIIAFKLNHQQFCPRD